jgi:predicted ATPase
LRIADEELVAIRQRDGKPKESRQPFLGKSEETSRLHLRMEGQAHPTYFQVGLDHAIVSTALYEPHYPHIIAFRKELEKWKTFYLEPKELMREEVPLAEISSIGPRGENLAAFLNTLKEGYPKEFETLNLTIKQILPTKPAIDIELHKEGLLGLILHEDGLSFSARLISEGTLRVIGLICAIHPKNPSLLIGYEEPENGVHPIRLKHIAILFKNAARQYGKQVFITTHSPLFGEMFDSKDLYVCEKVKNYSTIKPFDEIGPLYKPHQIETALTESILRGDFPG